MLKLFCNIFVNFYSNRLYLLKFYTEVFVPLFRNFFLQDKHWFTIFFLSLITALEVPVVYRLYLGVNLINLLECQENRTDC